MIHSGIPGLDEILGGGIPENSTILLNGGPGSGKTTLAIQFLYNGIVKNGEPGIFVTLCEDPEQIRKNMLIFGWDLAKLEKQKKLIMVDARPVYFTDQGYIVPNESLLKSPENIPFSHISRLITDKVRESGAKRLAIDSVTVLTTQYENTFYVRQGLLGLIQALCGLDCTSILLSESRGERDEEYLERVLVPGVILLYYSRKASSMVRAIQVWKMRGLNHSSDIYHMEISKQGIIVHPEERAEL